MENFSIALQQNWKKALLGSHSFGYAKKMNEFYLPICPVAKPRMTKRDRWSKRPAVVKYWAFKDQLADVKSELASFIFDNADVQITFGIQIPKSYSKTKANKCLFKFHKQRPDIDNLLKGLLDGVMDEDSAVCSVYTQKRWVKNGCVLVTAGKSFEEIVQVLQNNQGEAKP